MFLKKIPLRFLIQLAISAGLVAVVLSGMDMKSFRSVVSLLSLPDVLFFSALIAGSQMISAFRWWLIARAANLNVPFAHAVRAFFIGMYANMFGLGTVGGDVVRGGLLAHQLGKKAEGVTSAFVDRVIGLVVLLFIGLAATGIYHSHKVDSRLITILIVIGVGLISGWFIAPGLFLRFVPKESRFRNKLEQMASVFCTDAKKLSVIAAVAALYHFVQIGIVWMIAEHLGAHASAAEIFTGVPFINILSALPISWNGLGVREKAYTFFLSPDTMQPEQAVAVGMTWFVSMTIVSACGGLLGYLGTAGQKTKQVSETA